MKILILKSNYVVRNGDMSTAYTNFVNQVKENDIAMLPNHFDYDVIIQKGDD